MDFFEERRFFLTAERVKYIFCEAYMKILLTERLILRPWREEDYMDMYEYAQDPLVGPSAGWTPHKNPEESRVTILRFQHDSQCDTWAVTLRRNCKVVGSLGMHKRSPQLPREGYVEREIGYVLNPLYWGQGIMPEAVKAVLEYAFLELQVDIVWCGHYDFNQNSKRVIEKCGFTFRFGRDEILGQLSNKRVWSLFYSIERKDYLRMREAEEGARHAFSPKCRIKKV